MRCSSKDSSSPSCHSRSEQTDRSTIAADGTTRAWRFATTNRTIARPLFFIFRSVLRQAWQWRDKFIYRHTLSLSLLDLTFTLRASVNRRFSYRADSRHFSSATCCPTDTCSKNRFATSPFGGSPTLGSLPLDGRDVIRHTCRARASVYEW